MFFRAVLALKCQIFDFDAKIALKNTFSTWEEAENLTAASSYIQLSAVKISACSDVENWTF